MNRGILALTCACLQLLFAAGGKLSASPVSESDSAIFVYRNLDAATTAGETGCKSCEDGPPIDLSVNKEVDKATPNIGDEITYTLTLANKGGSQRKATWITVVDTPPSGLTFVSAIEPGGTSFNPATMTWSVGRSIHSFLSSVGIISPCSIQKEVHRPKATPDTRPFRSVNRKTPHPK